MKAQLLFLAPVALSLVAVHPALAISSGDSWMDFRGSQIRCMDNADRALRATGHTDISRNNNNVSGSDGEYLSVIRCAASQRFVFFYSVGSSSAECVRIVDRLKEKF